MGFFSFWVSFAFPDPHTCKNNCDLSMECSFHPTKVFVLLVLTPSMVTIIHVNSLMLSFKQVSKVMIKILPPIISTAVYILQNSSSHLLHKQPTWFLRRPSFLSERLPLFGPFSTPIVLLFLLHCLTIQSLLPSAHPTLVYLDVAPLNIYAEIHYLSIKYASAWEPESDNMYFLLQAQSDN